jgi:hypothetical protein
MIGIHTCCELQRALENLLQQGLVWGPRLAPPSGLVTSSSSKALSVGQHCNTEVLQAPGGTAILDKKHVVVCQLAQRAFVTVPRAVLLLRAACAI